VTETKRCSTCGKTKAADEFGWTSKAKRGRLSQCRRCAADAALKRYHENRDACIARMRKYKAENKDRLREQAAEYRARNRAQRLEQGRQRYAENREQYAERWARYYAENRERLLERHREWVAENKEQQAEYGHRYFRELKGAVLAHYGDPCACCGGTDRLSIDHVNGDGAQHRAADGLGSSDAMYRWLISNNFPEGFQTLCSRCNSSKSRGDQCRLDHSPAASARLPQPAGSPS
jgi:hypothetical protein